MTREAVTDLATVAAASLRDRNRAAVVQTITRAIVGNTRYEPTGAAELAAEAIVQLAETRAFEPEPDWPPAVADNRLASDFRDYRPLGGPRG